MTFSSFTIPAVFVSVLFSSCVSQQHASQVKGSESARLKYQWEKYATEGLEEAGSPKGLEIPVVVFKSPGAGFSAERWFRSSLGNYSAHCYKNDKSPDGQMVTLRIFGSPQIAPVLVDAPSVDEPTDGGSTEVPREWMTVRAPALGKDIRYYHVSAAMGDTNDVWESEIFTVKGANGAVGSYKAAIESSDGTVVARSFGKLGVR